MLPEYDATRCPKCGDTWTIRRIEPAAAGAHAVHLRICSCDKARCRNHACQRQFPVTEPRCPHCGTT